MLSKQITLINKLGLHARASSKLVKTANRFAATINIDHNGAQADAKSIMDVMMLGAACGSNLTFNADGSDQELAIEAIEDLINNRFGEEE